MSLTEEKVPPGIDNFRDGQVLRHGHTDCRPVRQQILPQPAVGREAASIVAERPAAAAAAVHHKIDLSAVAGHILPETSEAAALVHHIRHRSAVDQDRRTVGHQQDCKSMTTNSAGTAAAVVRDQVLAPDIRTSVDRQELRIRQSAAHPDTTAAAPAAACRAFAEVLSAAAAAERAGHPDFVADATCCCCC